MTWEFQATIADDIHRVVSSDGRSAWGVVHGGFDEGDSRVIDLAEVVLPTEECSLLIVPVSPGGLVLDIVRAYQGLTESELCTLFLGIIDELRSCSTPEVRLTLSAFALDAAGRPVIIPGVSAPVPVTPRRAVGEMLYHAVLGRPWAESLLPVDLALTDCSRGLRALVSDLLSDGAVSVGVDSTLAEVAESLRTLARPAALPLIPAESETAPESALTARLRAASGHRPHRSAETESVGREPADDSARDGAHSSGTLAPRLRSAGLSSLRADARRSETLRPRPARKRRAALNRLPRMLVDAANTVLDRLRRVSSMQGFGLTRVLIASAVALTLIGGAILWATWPSVEPSDGGTRAVDSGITAETEGVSDTSADSPSAQASGLSAAEVADILEELCAARAQALSQGDSHALQALTVPDSAAAAADELVDPSEFSGMDLAIQLEDVKVVSDDADGVIVSALMRSRAGTGADARTFRAQTVEFELQRVADSWLIAEVRDIKDS